MRQPCPTPIKGCKYGNGCYADDHHLLFPASRYTTEMEKEYRELFVVNICRRVHDFIHDSVPPPPKPTRREMKITLAQYRR